MRSPIHPWRRALSAALGALYLVLALGAGAHRGPHLESAIVELPADLHHHAYGFVAGAGDRPLADPCMACQLSRLEFRIHVPPVTLAALPAAVAVAPAAPSAEPTRVDLTARAPRAPPQA